MTKRSTKQQLLLSAISLLLCVSMLVGSTFAWFTDSVTSTNNIIKSGTLDVELYYDNSETAGKDYQKVTNDSNIFVDGALWEPGYTEVVTLKVANEGTLALKYTLGINVASEIAGKNVEGKEFKLSDYIYFGIVEGEKTFADRKAAIEAVKANAMPIRRGFKSELAELVAPGTTGGVSKEYVTVVVYMPETVGNEANYRTDDTFKNEPEIKLGLNLFATQVEYESDSFDNTYDENAAFSVWNGTVPAEMPATLVVDGDTQTVHVKDAAAFAYLSTLSAEWADLYTDGQGRTYTNYANGKGADYYYSGKWTISLEADIDLDNKYIDPVKIVFGEATGASTFNGNGHIIRNINTTTGLFENGTQASFSNLILDTVKATNGALTGTARSSIADVTVKNATISGDNYVGGLVGSAYGNVTGCEVIDSTVIASGKEAGGLIGYIETNSNTTSVTNNLVKNVSVYANNRAAGLVAQPNVNILVYNNHIDTVTVGAEDLSTYQAGAVVSNALDPKNVYDNTVINANVATAPVAVVADSTKLTDAINAGKKVVLVDDVEFKADITSDATIDLGGNALTMTNSDQTVSGSLAVSNGTVNTSKGYFDVRPVADGEEIVYENVTFNGTKKSLTYGNSTDRVSPALEFCSITQGFATNLVFKNCTFNDANVVIEAMSDTAAAVEVLFDNCTFNNFGNSDAIEISNYMTVDITIKDCDFNFVATSNINVIDALGSSTVNVTFEGENTVYAESAVPTTDSSLVGTVDEVKVFSTQSVKVASSAVDSVSGLDTVTVTGIATK